MNLDRLVGKLPDRVLAEIPAVVGRFDINTPFRLSHFLGQCYHESIGFKATRENLNYSVSALLSVFKKYFPTRELAEQYARKPEKIGSRVYANRMGNGDEASGEGWKFRGAGYIQLTGKDNYRAFQANVPEDIISRPELVAIQYPLFSAAWFWGSRNLNALADRGMGEDVIRLVTKKINGGYNGLNDRIFHTTKIFRLLDQ